MTEAWLLFDEAAIRLASGNPNGAVPLDLPTRPEREPDPRTVLRNRLVVASEFKGRRRKKLDRDLPHRVQLVAENIKDFAPLLRQPAFAEFERRFDAAIQRLR